MNCPTLLNSTRKVDQSGIRTRIFALRVYTYLDEPMFSSSPFFKLCQGSHIYL